MRHCVSFCNQPKAQFGYLRRVTPVCRCLQPFCGWRHLATARESKAHFGLPWVHPWDNRGKCHMDEKEDSMLVKCITAYTHLSSTVYELQRDIGRKLQLFLPPCIQRPRWGCSNWSTGKSVVFRKLESWGYQAVMTVWTVLTQYQRVTDRRPAYINNMHSMTDTRKKTCIKFNILK